MKLKDARVILAEYLARMDLVEWTVLLRWGNRAEMEGVDGKCVWSPEYAHCQILLSRDQDDAEIPLTIVHELVHVALQGHRDHDGRYSAMYERGINRLTQAIIRR